MANPTKGEVSVQALGQAWTLVYDFNALCSIDEDLGVNISDLDERLAKPSMIRSIFRVGLEAKHGSMTDLEAGRIIHDVGPQKAAEAVAQAFQAAFPAPDAASAEGKAEAAPKKKAGTGRER